MQIRFAAILVIAPALSVWADGSTLSADQRLHAVGVGAPAFSRFLLDETVVNAPLSARVTTLTVQELYDGNRLVNETVVMLFRDSAGRVRQEPAVSGYSQSRATITISDPVIGQVLTLDPENRRAFRLTGTRPFTSTFTIRLDDEASEQPADGSVQVSAAAGDSTVSVISGQVQMPESAGAVTSSAGGVSIAALPTTFFVGRFNHPASLLSAAGDGRAVPEVVLESLGDSQIGGVAATGQRQTTTYPVGVLGNELPIVVTKDTWYSPDLRMVVGSEERDPRFGTISYSVEVLSTEEPDSALFELPADYRVTSPVIEPAVTID